jgi:hypothetical protein
MRKQTTGIELQTKSPHIREQAQKNVAVTVN